MKNRTALEEKAIAYHEAGHVVAAYLHRVPIRYATILPSETALGHVLHQRLSHEIDLAIDVSDRARLSAERKLLSSLAGPAAEIRFRKRSRSVYSFSDDRKALEIAVRLSSSTKAAEALLKWL
jgi:ATP-dependent Zn protease